MTSAKNVANAVGGKTARACYSCITKRARWYCAADDAFLCQSCDSSVHSANPLASRHERVRLKMGSCRSSEALNCAPSWQRGFTKKARTPRHGNKHSTATLKASKRPFHLVPEVGYSDDTNSNEESGEKLLYRVPIFDPFVAELCATPSSVTSSPEAVAVAGGAIEVETKKGTKGSESKVSLGYNNIHGDGVESLHGFLPSDIELAEFAADVESLLGKGLENQCMGMEELGLIDDSKGENSSWECCVGSGKVVKVEEEEKPEVAAAARACKVEVDQMEMGRESFELSFDYDDIDDSAVTCDEVEEKVALDMTKDVKKNGGELKENNNQAKRKIMLQLDYEAVITAWASQKSPWVAGDKPAFEPDQCWPHCLGTCGMELHHKPYGELGGFFGGHPAMADGGREARVSRYREKRRTRMFSKKIRYEVRKMNAEKRPRMKGRFVKRASFAAPLTLPLVNK